MLDFLSSIYFQLLLAIILVGSVSIYMYSVSTFGYWKKRNINGPNPKPMTGTTFVDLDIPMHKRYSHYLKKYGKIVGAYIGRTPQLVVHDPEILKIICVRDFDHFTDRMTFDFTSMCPALNKVMTNLEGEEWKHVRNHLTPAFTSGKLKQMSPLMGNCANYLLKNLRKTGDSNLNVTKTMSAFSIDVILSCAFGVEVNSQENPDNDFVEHSRRIFGFEANIWVYVNRVFPSILKYVKLPLFPVESVDFFLSACLKALALRKEKNVVRNDFLQVMLDSTKQENGLTESMIESQSLQILMAGQDTTSTNLSFALYSLAANPDLQQILIEEIDAHFEGKTGDITYDDVMHLKYLDMFVSETLRMYPAAVVVDRKCTRDWKYGNLEVQKGSYICIPIYAIHHNEEYYPNPEVFNPERFTEEEKANRHQYTYLPFGHGPRSCVGMRLALWEIKLSIVSILREFIFKTCKETQVPLQLISGRGLLKPKDEIILRVERRNTTVTD